MLVSNPCTLDEFLRFLDEQVQTELCQALVQTYGDVFRELQVVYGSKQGMLEPSISDASRMLTRTSRIFS